jgi:acyl carrier protein
MEEVLNQVNAIFKSVFEDNNLTITMDSSAKDIEKWDSLNHVLLIAELEREFNISFELDEMITFKNVGDIVNSINSKVG